MSDSVLKGDVITHSFCILILNRRKKNGKFIFSVDHPMMQALGAKELWPEENASWSYNY